MLYIYVVYICYIYRLSGNQNSRRDVDKKKLCMMSLSKGYIRKHCKIGKYLVNTL